MSHGKTIITKQLKGVLELQQKNNLFEVETRIIIYDFWFSNFSYNFIKI